MKRLFRLLLILGLAAGTWSCADDGTPSVSINGGTDFLSLDHLARSGKITVNAPAPWSVTLAPENYGQDEKPDWLTLSAEEGPAGYSEIDVTFAENPGPARSASLLFSCDGKTLAFTVSQSAGGTGFDAPDYYFYISVGTMPTLYSGLHLLSHDKPSYVSYERASTFDAAEFPDRAFVYPVADPTGHATNEELRAMSEAMKRRILEINAEDPTAVFGLWVDDLRCRLGYDWFVAQGIDSARVKVTMLSDGTATYNNFHNYFGDAATAEQNWNDYAAEVEALDWNHGGRYPETRAPEEFASYTWPYYLSTRPDYRLMLQNSSLMESSCPFIADRLAARPEIELLSISAEGRKDVNERAKVINSADLAFLCLPDAASREVMPLLRPDVRPVAEEKPHHHRHEPQFRRERTAAGGLCGTDHTAVRQRLRHLLQAPSRRQLVGRLPRPVRGADAAAGPDAVRNLRLGAARQNRHDRRLPLDDLYLRTARQGGLPLCRRCRRTRPAVEHPFPRRRERGMDSVNAPGAEKRHPARVAFFSRKKIPRRSRGPGKQLFN